MRKYRWTAALVIVALIVTVVAAGCAKKEDASEPIKIGVIAPLTGTLQFEGQQQLNGVKMAVDEVNKAGGINGRLITVIAEDSKGNATDAASAAEKLITKDKVTILQGAHMTTLTKAVMPILQKYGVAMVESVASVPELTDGSLPGSDYLYRVNPHAGMEAASFATFLYNNLGIKKLAMLVLNDDWGHTNVKLYTDAYQKFGGSIVSTDYYTTGETNFLPVLTKIKNSDADGLFLIAQAQDAAMIVKQAREIKYDKKIAGAGAFASDTFIQLAGKDADGIYGVVPYAATVDNPVNKAFVDAYKAAYPKMPTPDKYAAMSYMAGKVMLAAIQAAGSSDPAKVKAALDKVSVEGVTGTTAFDEHHQAHTDIYITVIDNGAIKIVQAIPTK